MAAPVSGRGTPSPAGAASGSDLSLSLKEARVGVLFVSRGTTAQTERPHSARTPRVSCASCGALFQQSAGRGRPRRYCLKCRPKRQSRKRVRPAERECDFCGKTYAPRISHPSNRFCSQSCRYRSRSSSGTSNVSPVRTRACRTCGSTFHVRYDSRSVFCSVACSNRHPKRKLVVRRTLRDSSRAERFMRRAAQIGRCVVCGQPTRSAAAGCSMACRAEVQRRYSMARWEEQARAKGLDPDALRGPRTCKDCGGEWTPTRATKRRRCPSCVSRVAHRKRRELRTHIGRAKARGVPWERIDKRRVFERDGYICGICGRKTRPDRKPTHPRYPNLDHIIPLSVDGTPGHVWSNVQCACFSCNVKKGARVLGQLRLV